MSRSSVETNTRSVAVDQAYINCQFNEIEKILRHHRLEDPDLYALLNKRKTINEALQAEEKKQLQAIVKTATLAVGNPDALPEPLYYKKLAQKILKEKIATHQQAIHAQHLSTKAVITPRTTARNVKQPHKTIAEEKSDRSDKLSVQIQAWRSLLPTLIAGFKKIKDPRRAKSIKHQLIVIMLYALFAFIFRLKSRREMNRELTGVAIYEHLQKLFPELTSIPHADTIARLLERINVNEIEKTHMRLINQLIRNKKFKKLLIAGALPIAIDGTQKIYREGELQDLYWLTRQVGTKESQSTQQYVYVLEANIVFKNGLTIPLLTEYLKTDWNVLETPEGKRDCELVAFERLSAKLKRYFPRLKLIIFADALFATQPVLEKLAVNKWDYVIQFSKNNLTMFAKLLNAMKKDQQSIPNQQYYREREQAFCWYNHVPWGYHLNLNVHLVSCLENWKEVDKKTGEIITKYAEHQWISSIKINIDNVHELLNLGARKLGLMEDSIHTEKHRGYHYEHAYSYHWNAMQCFHLLMRLAHAVNAISEFTKKMKQWIKEKGVHATLKLIKDTLFNPWLSSEWYEQQNKQTIRLTLQLE